MAGLSPPPGMILETDEMDAATATIQAVGFSSVASWTWSITGIGAAPDDVEPQNFTVTEAGLELSVEYIDEEGLFPLQHIDYLDAAGQRQRVDKWEGLPDPDQSPDLAEMREDDKDLLDWELSVTAEGTDTQGNPATASGTYQLRVYADYDASQQRLQEAIDARR